MTRLIASFTGGTALIVCASVGLNGAAPAAEAAKRVQEQAPADLIEEVRRLYYAPVQQNILSAA